jgi:outer membrane protein W
MRNIYLVLITIMLTTSNAFADSGSYFIKPVFGLSNLSDTNGQAKGIGQSDGETRVTLDNGFNAGLGFGYNYDENFSVELFWEYRSNGSQTRLADNTFFEDGNYASNIFFFNGYYFFNTQSDWQYFAGAGLGWVQEIDIDLETNGNELSYSGSGDIAMQVFAGLNYTVSENVRANIEVRVGKVSIDPLKGEKTMGSISKLDYTPSTLQIGFTWLF